MSDSRSASTNHKCFYLAELDGDDVLAALLVPDLELEVVGEVAALRDLEGDVLARVAARNPETHREKKPQDDCKFAMKQNGQFSSVQLILADNRLPSCPLLAR